MTKSIVERARLQVDRWKDLRAEQTVKKTNEFAQAVIDFAEALADIKAHSVEPFISETWTRYVHDVSITALSKYGVKVDRQ